MPSDAERIAELKRENQRLREANRRLQAEGPALYRDKVIAALTAEVERLESERASLADALNTELRENYGSAHQVEIGDDFRPAVQALVDGVRYVERFRRDAALAGVLDLLADARGCIGEGQCWLPQRRSCGTDCAMNDALTSTAHALLDVAEPARALTAKLTETIPAVNHVYVEQALAAYDHLAAPEGGR